MNQENLEKLLYAFEIVLSIKNEIEETGKHKRIVSRLDKACQEMMIASENIADKLK